MRHLTTYGIVLALAVGLILPGCNATQNATAATPPPSGLVQESAMADAAAQEAARAANQALVTNAQGSTTAISLAPAGGASPLGLFAGRLDAGPAEVVSQAVTYDFDASVSLTVNLATYSQNATGTVQVAASAVGQVINNGTDSGEVTYDVDLTFTTDVVATNPDNGVTVTWAAGTAFGYQVRIVWERQVDTSSTVSIVWDMSTNQHAITLRRAGATLPGTVNSMDIHAEATFNVSATQQLSITGIVLTGSRDVTWTSGDGVSHQVLWDIQSPLRIFITVDGTVFGPYTIFQIADFLDG